MFIANTGIGLLSQYGDNAQRCKATQCYDWPWQKTGLYCFFSLVNNYIFVDYISLLSLSLLLSLDLLFPSLFSFMLWFKSCANNYLSSVFLYVFFFLIFFCVISYDWSIGAWQSFTILDKNTMFEWLPDISKDLNYWLTIKYVTWMSLACL